jgi:intracellular sulfur oxidation DsrE/DsrF family protein
MSREAFEERYGEPSPDAKLVRQLAKTGVRFVVCWQSAAALGFHPDEFAPDVEMTLIGDNRRRHVPDGS